MAARATTSSSILEVQALYGGYGRKQVVFDVNFHLRSAEIVTILGHNGAGKTTTLKTVFGVLPPHRGKIVFQGRDVSHSTCRHNVLAGMSLIPSERFVFGDLTVIDNLRLGGLYEKSSKVRAERLERVTSMFPILDKRSSQLARTMSGGEQRMLSLGVAIMAGPKLLMLDEPSLGLAPILVQDLFASIRNLANEEGLTVLLLEQNVGQALRITDRVYVMRSGRIILEETADQMRERDQYWDLF